MHNFRRTWLFCVALMYFECLPGCAVTSERSITLSDQPTPATRPAASKPSAKPFAGDPAKIFKALPAGTAPVDAVKVLADMNAEFCCSTRGGGIDIWVMDAAGKRSKQIDVILDAERRVSSASIRPRGQTQPPPSPQPSRPIHQGIKSGTEVSRALPPGTALKDAVVYLTKMNID